MEPNREYKRFPRGSAGCDRCKTSRWYIDNGRKFCKNGHEVEGFIEFDVDVEDNFGNQGKIVRGQQAARAKKQYRHLKGKDGRMLYLVCLQIVLRTQIQWLVQQKGVDPELEVVCRGLWDLRIRKFVGLNSQNKDKGKGKGKVTDKSSDTEAGYSSQAESRTTGGGVTTEDEEEDEDLYGQSVRSKKAGRVVDWSSENWDPPAVMDTLAILYLGCLLRREAVRIGDIFRWAKNDQLPFLGAIDLIPTELRQPLPAWAQQALLTRYSTFRGSELHRLVMSLMLGYRQNYGMVFPKTPPARLLLGYIKELALPPHVHKATQELCARLDLELTFPTTRSQNDNLMTAPFEDQKPHSLLDLPEGLLVAAMVVAVKHLYPLEKTEHLPQDLEDTPSLRMDWAAWEEAFAQPARPSLGRLDFEKLDPQKIWNMSKDDIDEYLTWYEKTRIDKTRSELNQTDIEKMLFPLERPKPRVGEVNPEPSEEQITARMKTVQSAMKYFKPTSGDVGEEGSDSPLSIEPQSPVFETSEEATGRTNRFYEKVAEVSGLDVHDLTQAVSKLEMMLQRRLKHSHTP
ncbi:hypothetical protein V8F20_007066 [Naviculisporaceae sp. PSN 640]